MQLGKQPRQPGRQNYEVVRRPLDFILVASTTGSLLEQLLDKRLTRFL